MEMVLDRSFDRAAGVDDVAGGQVEVDGSGSSDMWPDCADIWNAVRVETGSAVTNDSDRIIPFGETHANWCCRHVRVNWNERIYGAGRVCSLSRKNRTFQSSGTLFFVCFGEISNPKPDSSELLCFGTSKDRTRNRTNPPTDRSGQILSV